MTRGAAFVRFLRASRKALFGSPHCRHQWETVSSERLYDHRGCYVARTYTLRCSHRGDMKKVRL